jgi:Tol biopolymer transport system component
MGVRPGAAILGLAVLVGGLGSPSAPGSAQRERARTGVVLTSRDGRVIAVNVDGSGVRELTHPRRAFDDAPVASPDGAAIAFSRGTAVYVMNADGTDERRVGPGGIGGPAWSPNSRWLAASTVVDRVYVMQADGAGARRIGPGDFPAWSPDGEWLAYQGDLETDESVHVVRLDGTKTFRLPRASAFAWSPDARSVGYSSPAGLSIFDVTTGQSRLLVASRALGRGVTVGDISWSPEGSRLAFVGVAEDSSDRVWLAKVDGSPPVRVGPPFDEQAPAWSPDGTRIAYAASVGLRERVVVADAASGRTVWKLRSIAGEDSDSPSWSADGNELVFERWNLGDATGGPSGTDVWVINADGTGSTQLTEAFPFSGVGDPTWWPGRTAVAPDPPLPTVSLRTVARRRGPRPYEVVGADGQRLAVYNFAGRIRVSYDGGWRSWKGLGSGYQFGDSAAFAGKRVYWADNDREDSFLETAARPGSPAKALRGSAGDSAGEHFTVGSDRSLVAFTVGRSLFLIRGTRIRHIRRERREIDLVDVDRGRLLLLRGDGRLELVSPKGRSLRLFSSRADHIQAGRLSGRRVVAVGDRRILVFDANTGRRRSAWQVGAPNVPPKAGYIYGSLLPYADGSALHVLDVHTGHDLVVRIAGVTEPVSGAVTKRGLLCTWTATYSKWQGHLGLVPLQTLKAALAKASRVG